MTRHRQGRRSFSSGFSMVELMVVTAIFAVVIMAVFSLVIPTQRSTVVQTNVADLQAGLRLALNAMTRDLLNAGFLVLDDPIVFPTGAGVAAENPADFTIRSKIVGTGFGQVDTNAGTTGVLPLGMDAMADNFEVGSKVCLYEPLQATALTANPATVTAVTDDPAVVGDATITINNTAVNVGAETVVVKVQNLTACPTGSYDPGNPQASSQTIRYRVNGGALERIVNGETHVLARNIAGVNFSYSWTPASSPPRKVRRVDILLQGQAQGVPNDPLYGSKDRDARTSVTLRNVFY